MYYYVLYHVCSLLDYISTSLSISIVSVSGILTNHLPSPSVCLSVRLSSGRSVQKRLIGSGCRFDGLVN